VPRARGARTFRRLTVIDERMALLAETPSVLGDVGRGRRIVVMEREQKPLRNVAAAGRARAFRCVVVVEHRRALTTEAPPELIARRRFGHSRYAGTRERHQRSRLNQHAAARLSVSALKIAGFAHGKSLTVRESLLTLKDGGSFPCAAVR
jgi:hypothetical protein